MQAINLLVTGRGSQLLAPASGVDLVRLADLQAAVSGCAPLAHTHTASQITNFNAGVLAVLAANGVPLSGIVNLYLTPSGGLIQDGLGLRVDSGIVSLVGHRHQSADIVDFASGVARQLQSDLVSTSSILWASNGNQLSGVVQLKTGLAPGQGAILADGGGLYVSLGSGVAQASAGNHTHSQLHNALTLGSSTSLGLTLSGQQLAGEILLAPLSGLLNTPSGVANDFGAGHNQVMRGDALAGLSLQGVTSVLNTATLLLGISGTVLSGVVPLDASPPSGYGVITTGMNGLRVRLGTDSQSAAAGNHIHTAATSVADGFMSSTSFNQLAALWAETPPSGVQAYSTNTLLLLQSGQNLSGVVQLKTGFIAGQGALLADGGGIYVVLGTGANVAAAGNHTHGNYLPLSGGTMTGVAQWFGTLTVSGVSQTAPVNPSGVAAWFAASVNGVAYKIPLYQ